MLAMLGMYVQALVTGKGPVSNWLEHLADPSSANGFAFATKFAPTLLARHVAAGLRSTPPSVARSVHRYSSSLPRRVATRRLRVGHFRTLRHSGSPHSQPRARTHSRPLGYDGCTRVTPPRAPVYLRRDTSGRTSLVQSRSPDLLRWRPGLPR